ARFACGIKTIGSDVPAFGQTLGAAWAADFFFGAAEQTGWLYQTNEIAGDLRVSGGVPFISDGVGTTEDSFFYYPECSYAVLSGTGSSPVGTYIFAVLYSY